MTIKPFAIQGADLTLGGVNLQAGTTTIVIPGVTQATNYRVEEVNETGGQPNPLNLPIVIDNVTHVAKVADAGANVSAYATYSAQLDDEDYVDEIEVNTAGTYVGSEVDRNADFDMWGYTGSDAEGYLTNWVTGDWVQIPFRPKMRAGEVENVGSGGSLEDIQVTRDDEDGFTELELADKDLNIRTTRTNPEQDADIGIYAADDLWLEAGGDDIELTAADEIRIYTNNANSSHEWIFNASGHVQFPDGSVQVTAYTGTGDDNIWIETFASDAPSADFVQGATSVEYDADGNIIALFSHYEPGPNSSYTSVAKLTPTGAVLWQVRFAANLYTDGWGLAYDTVDNIVYVAGRTSGTPLTYEFATLTKLNGAFGNIIWSKTYDFEADSQSAVVDIDGDGNPVMVGYSYNGTDNYIITTKVDKADGSVVWSKTLDGQGDDQAYGMAIGPSNEIVTIGYTSQLGEAGDTEDHMLVVKYATDGTIAWQKAVLFDAGYDCSGADADIDSAGNIYVCGSYRYTVDFGTTSAMSLVKFNSSGVKQWSRRVVGNCDTFGTSVVVGDDNQLYLSGVTANNNASDYTWVVAKYNTDGVVTWQRLIDNTTTWTFGGAGFLGVGGGSNIAVKNGYVALAGTFGDPGTQPIAVVLQIDTDATPFSVGDWDFKGATFSGVLNGTASDIVVVDANKPVATVSPAVGTFASGEDTSNFLTVTRYGLGSVGTGDITFDGVKIIGDTTDNDLNAGGIKLIPNIAYEGAGQYVKIYPTMGQDAPHIHMAAGTGGDLLIGDDNHYVDVNHNGDIIIKAETDNSNKVRNLVENFQSNIWNGSWTSAEWSGTQIYFTEVSGSLKRWIIKYLDQSRVLGRSLVINGSVNLTYNSYSTEINGGFTIFVAETAPSATAVTTVAASCVMENYVEVNADDGQLGIITRSGWNVNISAGYESDVNIDAGDDIRITAGTKVRSDNAGGIITIEAGDGGMGDHNDWGGEGGAVNIYGGNGGTGSSDYQGGDGAGILIRAGMGGASNGAGGGNGGTLQLLGGDSYSNNAGGDIYIRPGASLTNGSGMVTIETVSTASVTNTWQFTKQGTTALPGALVNSTVAKTGSGVPGSGQVATVTLGSTNNTNFTPGVYPGLGIGVGTGYTLTLTVAGNGDLTVEVTASGTGFLVGDQANLLGAAIAGGSSPADDIVLTVATLSNIVVATALDLTKSVNKLTNGYYTLADGVEGQIMYLVRQTGAAYNLIRVNVANARVDGGAETTIDYYPFETSLNMSTLIFTDGAWQASVGGWD